MAVFGVTTAPSRDALEPFDDDLLAGLQPLVDHPEAVDARARPSRCGTTPCCPRRRRRRCTGSASPARRAAGPAARPSSVRLEPRAGRTGRAGRAARGSGTQLQRQRARWSGRCCARRCRGAPCAGCTRAVGQDQLDGHRLPDRRLPAAPGCVGRAACTPLRRCPRGRRWVDDGDGRQQRALAAPDQVAGLDLRRADQAVNRREDASCSRDRATALSTAAFCASTCAIAASRAETALSSSIWLTACCAASGVSRFTSLLVLSTRPARSRGSPSRCERRPRAASGRSGRAAGPS